MQLLNSAVFDKWWGRAVLTLCLGFIAWFVVVERDGLVTLIEWLANAIILLPDGLEYIVGYYADIPSQQLLFSILVGILFGIVFTILLNPSKTGEATRFNVSGKVFLIGGLGGAFGSQLLSYPMQHCTYASQAPGIQAFLGVIITAIGTLVVLIPLWTFFLRPRQSKNLGSSGYFANKFGLGYWFVLPTILSLSVFLYFPAVEIIKQSMRVQVQFLPQQNFVCLDNYVRLAEDTIYQNSFLITMIITVLIVLLTMSTALSIAMLASQKVRGANVYRTFLVWPYALSPVVTGVIFVGMFRQGRSGLINAITYQLFGETYNWLTTPELAVAVIVLASVWNALGFNVLFYIAGLQNVPKDVLEAAEIDGANRLQRFLRVTFPLLSPYTFFLLVTNVTYSFYGIYGAIDTLTGGGPPLGPGGRDGGATDVLIYKLYEDAFTRVGDSAAQALILFMLVAGLTVFQFGYVERRVTYAD